MKDMKKLIAIIAILVATVCVDHAHAQDPYQDWLRRQISVCLSHLCAPGADCPAVRQCWLDLADGYIQELADYDPADPHHDYFDRRFLSGYEGEEPPPPDDDPPETTGQGAKPKPDGPPDDTHSTGDPSAEAREIYRGLHEHHDAIARGGSRTRGELIPVEDPVVREGPQLQAMTVAEMEEYLRNNIIARMLTCDCYDPDIVFSTQECVPVEALNGGAALLSLAIKEFFTTLPKPGLPGGRASGRRPGTARQMNKLGDAVKQVRKIDCTQLGRYTRAGMCVK